MRIVPPLHVSIVAFPDGAVSTLSGVFDVLQAIPQLAKVSDVMPDTSPFNVEIVATQSGQINLASGVSISAQKGIDDIAHSDIVIVPSVYVSGNKWEMGRYPQLVRWLVQMQSQGAVLCSACSGVFLIAETGLLNRQPTTIHWAYTSLFKEAYPEVPLFPEKVLVASGDRQEFVSSGASTSWHDLVLYLVVRYAGPSVAQLLAKFFALQWHREGLAPYFVFHAPFNHGDSIVRSAQDWLAKNFSIINPVSEAVNRANIPERTLKRRFSQATGMSMLHYIQQLRIEEAKRRLERTETPVEEISWRVGYEDSAFFRRLFKRTVGITPGAFRKKFQIPSYD